MYYLSNGAIIPNIVDLVFTFFNFIFSVSLFSFYQSSFLLSFNQAFEG